MINLQDECHLTSLPVLEAEAGQRRSGDQWQPSCHYKIPGPQTASAGRCVWYGTRTLYLPRGSSTYENHNV